MIKKSWKNYYLPFLTNFLICLGVVISIGLIYDPNNVREVYVSNIVIAPIWVTNITALVALFATFYYFYQEIFIKRFHVAKKYFLLVFIAQGLSLVAIILNSCIGLSVLFANILIPSKKLLLWICIGIDGGIWLIANTLSWYGCALVELKHRQKLTEKEPTKTDKKKEKQNDQKTDASPSASLDSFV